MRAPLQTVDPRCLRTRDALQSAFILLALRKAYDDIRIDDILAAAGVGRSTFYEHYSDKHGLLAASMHGALSILADMPMRRVDARQVAVLLTHFWQRRDRFRELFQGPGLAVVRDQLVAQVENRLERQAGSRIRLPNRLAAVALADGMFSPIVAWLGTESTCSPADLADALVTSSAACHASLVAASDT